MKPDLTLLYTELGLQPNCSLQEFQLAYRRRISELQPNRVAGGSQSPETAFLLRDLIGLYTTASRFHRRYGRLPGAAPRRFGTGPFPRATLQQTYVAYDARHSESRPGSSSRIALVLAIALLILLFGLLALASGEWFR
ncbi:hypothetical protein ACFPOA_08405 [Lysobacter niabensis]|uniref:hypothetical protein n=1 Tax=Agrilutibacter niabensis TaxID=380628 RepID=UPI00360C3D56